jgi:hypothetical protein
MVDQPNCHKCKWSNQSSFDSSTHHRSCQLEVKDTELLPEIRLSEHGVLKGWCSWPYDFDPIWIDKCTAFEEKEEKVTP